MRTRMGEPADIPGVLALQAENLYENLTEEARGKGFVTTPFTVGQLEALRDQDGLFVAESGGAIVGYAMAASWDYFSQWPIFPFMVSRLPGLSFQGRALDAATSFQYGPVCIAASQRGTGLFPRLFETMRLAMRARYPVGVTFINRINEHSFRAHTRTLGMTVVDAFDFAGRSYHGLAFDTGASVLRRPDAH